MVTKFNAHIISILFVALIFLIIQFFLLSSDSRSSYYHIDEIENYTQLDFLDLSNPKDQILLRESLDFFEPHKTMQHDTLLSEIELYLKDRFTQTARSRDNEADITLTKLSEILMMILKFSFIYVLVLLITYYGVETFATYRFIRFQQGRGFVTRLLVALDKIQLF